MAKVRDVELTPDDPIFREGFPAVAPAFMPCVRRWPDVAADVAADVARRDGRPVRAPAQVGRGAAGAGR